MATAKKPSSGNRSTGSGTRKPAPSKAPYRTPSNRPTSSPPGTYRTPTERKNAQSFTNMSQNTSKLKPPRKGTGGRR